MTNPIIKYKPNGNKFYKQYVVNGKLHRDPLEGPAIIWYYNNGKIECIEYWFNDEFHNPYGPAKTSYSENGQKVMERYLINGECHRDPLEGPAEIWYDEKGQIETMFYMENGKFHNKYGPAYIDYEDGFNISWHLNGNEYINEVEDYLEENNLDYKTMTELDFDIMWACIL